MGLVRWLAPRPYQPVGLVVAAASFWMSLTPGLLPRDATFQGVVSGVAAAVGYGLGVAGVLVVRFMLERELAWHPGRRVAGALAAAAGIVTVVAFVWYRDWQGQLRSLMGMDPASAWQPVVIVLLTAACFVLLVAAARLIARGTRWVVGRPRLPADLGLARPAWRELVASGPTVDELTAFGDRLATQPIRSYVGLDSAGSIRAEGETVRFVARPENLGRPDTPWPAPRVVYLQYASDPITWWDPRLLFVRPDWLKEGRGYDVLASTRWFPVVTFLQITADMAVGHHAPDGHGHSFGAAPVDAWVAILKPPDWTSADTARLRELIAAQSRDRRESP